MRPVIFRNALIFLVSITGSAIAINPIKTTTLEVKEVVVFLNGAQIKGTGNVSVPAGSSEIIIENLPESISEDQIQVKGEGDFIIQSVVKKQNYLNENKLPKEIKILVDSVELLNSLLEREKGLEKIYNQEEEVLMSNKSIGGNNNGVNILELEKITNFIRNRLIDLGKKRIESLQKQKKLQEQIDRVNAQLTELYDNNRYRSSELTITVSANVAQKAKFIISYFVPNAGWIPYYDIRATDASSPIKLEYKAHVWQTTGYSWEGVRLTLSTGNPFAGGTKPDMQPHWVDFKVPVRHRTYKLEQAPQAVYMESDALGNGILKSEANVIAESAAAHTSVTESATNLLFEIAIPYTIPSDGKRYSVSVQESLMNATYKYYAAPKLDKDAFLVAYVGNWDQYNLISADANIYFEGMFVGKTYINTSQTADTLEVSLGRDKSIAVTREKLKDFTEKKVIGMSKKETYGYEIAIKNNKKKEIEIVLQDQIPVSANKDIVVELNEKSNASYDAEKGFLIWNLKIKSGSSEKVKLSYSVQYPKDKIISGVEY
jgi:uncharacterized protein (TIGR02231 family)